MAGGHVWPASSMASVSSAMAAGQRQPESYWPRHQCNISVANIMLISISESSAIAVQRWQRLALAMAAAIWRFFSFRMYNY